MHDTLVVMQDGRRFCGPMWYFRPEEGWMTVVDDRCNGEPIYFRDMASAVTYGERVGIQRDENGNAIGPEIADVDEIERARQQGWDGT